MPKFFRGVVPAWLTRSLPARRGDRGAVAASPVALAANAAVEALEDRKLFAITTLTNGVGDGTLNITVDAYGAYGYAATPPAQPILEALYDPVGPIGPTRTTAESGVWFSPIDNFLAEGNLAVNQGLLAPVAFTTVSANVAVSNFVQGGFAIELTQTVNPVANQGTLFTQAYRVVNNSGAPQTVRFVRHVDGEMSFGTPLLDWGGVSADGNTVYIFDNATTPTASSGFFAISSSTTRGTNTGFGIHGFNGGYFDDIDTAKGIPNNDLNQLIGPGIGQNADANSDLLTDTNYDVTGSLQTDFVTIGVGETFTYTTLTQFGQGAPSSVIGIGPPAIQLSDPVYSVSEDSLFATIQITRTGSTAAAASVDLDILVGGTATPGLDFTDPTTPTVLSVPFAIGQAVATVQIPINTDLLVEGDETVLLQISNPSAGSNLGFTTDATLTIEDATPFFEFQPTSVSVSENVGVAQIQVVRSGSTVGVATVNYQVLANGTATAGDDFTVVSGTLTFTDGQSDAFIDVPISLDFLREDDETFTIELGAPVNAALGPDTSVATVTIVNFITPPTVLDVDTVGFNNRITQIVLSYSSDMEPTAVVARTNYDLFVRKEKPLGGSVSRLGRVSLKKARFEYNEVVDTVTITLPGKGLKYNRFYEIGVSGTRTGAPTDIDDVLFDGNADTIPGEDYRNYFGRGDHLRYYDLQGDLVELQTLNGSVLDIDRPVLRDEARVEMQDVFPLETVLTGTWEKSRRAFSDNQSTIILLNSFGVTRQLPPQIVVIAPDLP